MWYTQRSEGLEHGCDVSIFWMYYAKHEYHYRSDDARSEQCDESVDAVGCDEEELRCQEAYAPQVTRPWETERNR